MTVEELFFKLDNFISYNPEYRKLEVVVPIIDKDIVLGESPNAKVINCIKGFDWNSNLLFLITDIKLKENKNKE